MGRRRRNGTAASIPAALLVDSDPREPGTPICAGTILGRAVPWKSATVSIKTRRDGTPYRTAVRDRDYKTFEGWKAAVARDAGAAMRRHRPYGGPVELRLVFFLRPGKGTTPDLSNLVKSTEDGMQGIIFVNDRQVRRTLAERVMSATEAERVEFEVLAL